MSKKLAAVALGVVAVMAIGVSPASAAGGCVDGKLKAIGKKEAGLLKCQSKNAAHPDTAKLGNCESKAMTKFGPACTAAGACTGDCTTCENLADDCESNVSGDAAFTGNAVLLKAGSKLAKRELKCYTKAAARGLPVDTVKCLPTAQSKFAAAGGTGAEQNTVESDCVDNQVATDGGGSPPTGNVTAICGGGGATTTTTTTLGGGTTTTTTILSCFVTKWGTPGSGDGQFDQPFGVATDASGNVVYVTDYGNARVQKFDANGTFLMKWGSGGSSDGQFNFPDGIATDASGNVYVADNQNERIQKFSSSGTFLTKWGSIGSGDGQFIDPEGVASDGVGNVYVADTGNNRIQKFDSSGTFLTKWGSAGSGDGQFDFHPSGGCGAGLATDASGNVYVTDTGNFRVQKFDSSGTFLTKWGSAGSGDGQFSTCTVGVATDGSSNVYVAETGNAGRIQKFDSNGTFLTKWQVIGQYPWGIAADASGNVYVVENVSDWVEKFFGCP